MCVGYAVPLAISLAAANKNDGIDLHDIIYLFFFN